MNDKKYNAKITGVGMYVPDKVLDNKYFESIVDTNDEWIRVRTGIRERRILEQGATSDLAAKAALDLFDKHNINPEDIDAIIVATVTPDMFFPATACLVQDKIGAKNAWGFDLSAACSGFLFAFQTGASLVETGRYKKVLVIGADKMSSIVDYTDRNICILFGDAGSAVLLEPSDDKSIGLQKSILRVDGTGKDALNMLGGGSLNPATYETVDKKWHYIYQDGKAVFKVAVKGMADVSAELMEMSGLKSDDIAYLVPHQANLRIIDATAERMGLSKEKVMINIDKFGNTTAATIPLCLTEYYRDGKLKKGDNLILSAFGAGYTWGALHVVWSI
ncbi:MAG: ketoacyl-ACP synthase III [Ignavibacteriota bacterium]|jgi:3-oxoacyl-[acyl-carrier-protein] synthase-3|nr:ketoacyl-ACP synthase III [Ignavibacteriota bacterium]MBW7843039.1 ketoacyl-ACP synthase III [Ignavibacterium sp.]MCO6447099.1 ketoacyl-ACP synthase III [Ignavibacterium album]MCZ2269027.1 ketoacyl-ACP synthase III [Ignavibacteriales bacterium]MDX9712097.1 beta-ketoacyl-ACP synthase III [Ignavibacteriaceae bacterium]